MVIPLFIEVLLDLVGDHHEYLSALIHQLAEAQVPDTLLSEVGRSYELDALDLAEVSGVAKQVEEE